MANRAYREVVPKTPFARRLKAARIAASFETQATFARDLGISEERYRMWERGDREPNVMFLVKLSDRLKVTLDFLLREPNRPLRVVEQHRHTSKK